MPRPCLLVIDREHVGSISTRKLVIETAKLNVITAYSAAEALELLERFPRVDGIVMDAVIPDMRCKDLLQRLKAAQPQMPVIVIGTPRPVFCDGADDYVESFDPARLLERLRCLLPDAQKVMDKEKEADLLAEEGRSNGSVQ